jgi:hypothetical protein
MPAPPIIPVKNAGKGKQDEEETVRNRKRKRKQGDDSEAYKSRYDLTAEQQVMCNTMPIEAMLTCQLSCRRGHKPSELTAQSLSFTAAITNSYVCAIEKVRHSTFRTLSPYVQSPRIQENPSWYLRRSYPRYDGSYEAAAAKVPTKVA